MEPTASLARRLWHAIEPIHAVVYFDEGPINALRETGLRGFWMTYFAGRFSPLGAIGPGPAAAMAYGFAPAMVSRALPDAWRFAPPERVLAARLEGAADCLERHMAAIGAEAKVQELAELLAVAAEGCRWEGRPLAAGWLEVMPGNNPYGALWVRTSILREHRGDGHVLAAVGLGLLGLEATLTHVSTGAITREMMQRSRGWDDVAWDSATRQLQARRILDRDGRLTKTGGSLRRQLEQTTDRLAAGPVERLGQTGVERIIELATPISRHLIDSGVVPLPNPIGVPRP
jgi:hypothetical protein